MTHYICCPQDSIPKKRRKGAEYISLYGTKILADFEVGDVALDLKKDLRASGIRPTAEAWDFCSIAMAVAAVDESALRKTSADGWTRVLKVEIQLAEPLIWQNQIPALEETLRFLTGDFWSISLTSGGEPPPEPKKIKDFKADCVSLLSGGVDSLVGAIDLCSSGKKPILVSKLVSGDREFQAESASRLVPAENHIQWSFNSRSTSEGEDSTRARSIIFFAYAALVASSLASQLSLKKKIPIYVPENGFISLNLPLTPLRMGTLSTKTTHPVYLHGLQRIWDAVGINAELLPPFDYRFRTKGEMLDQCSNKDLLAEIVGKSTSCGRYGVYNHTHCGRCIPCLVRRAAFLRAGLADTTELSSYKGVRGSYVFKNLAAAAKEKTAVDIRAAGRACMQVDMEGVERFIGGGLAFASREDRPKFVGVVERGLAEIQALLKKHRVL
jgi:hypothetical protein